MQAWTVRDAIGRAMVAVALGGLAACATAPKNMPPKYVSPAAYRDLDCEALDREMSFTAARTNELYDRLKDRYERDKWQAGFAWLYGITALYLDGDGPEADEYRQLKGEFDALRAVAELKGCGLSPTSPEEIIRRAEEASAAGKSPPATGGTAD